MTLMQVLAMLVQMSVCQPVAVPDQGAYALICPLPKEALDAIVAATSDPA